MKKLLLVALMALTVTSMLGCATTSAPKGDGWVSIFNGKDLTGWENRSGHDEIWVVKDSVLDCNPRTDLDGDKNLWSTEEYGDIQLYMEWRIKRTEGKYMVPTVLPDGSHKKGPDGKEILTPTPNADSGIYLRGTSKAQVNIWCWPIGSGEVYGYRMDQKQPPEVRAGVTPKVCADKPVGEWNAFLITMQGDRLTVELNGKTVLDNAQLPGVPETGLLALQQHGGYDATKKTWNPASSLVQFRNIKVKKLD